MLCFVRVFVMSSHRNCSAISFCAMTVMRVRPREREANEKERRKERRKERKKKKRKKERK